MTRPGPSPTDRQAITDRDGGVAERHASHRAGDRPVTVRLRLDIAYDGTGFHGWAVQPGRRTVAGVLGEALATLFREPVPMTVAGRTDAGVHALGQVAHVDVDPVALGGLVPRHLPVSPDALAAGAVGLRRRLAGLLPADLRVRAAGVAPDGFDARFSALRRHYRYRIAVSEWGVDPLRRFDTLVWRRRLDVVAMQRAADGLIGLHDFAAYCKPREGGTTVRDLQRLTVTASPLTGGTRPGADDLTRPAATSVAGTAQPWPEPTAAPASPVEHRTAHPPGESADDGALVSIHVTADAFCHSMVRSLVGVLVAVGEGRFTTDRPADLLVAGRRTPATAVAPAHGLTLVGVDYPSDGQLAARAALTRAVREVAGGPPPGPGSL